MVVPVEVALGNGMPFACSAALRVWLEKSKPGIMMLPFFFLLPPVFIGGWVGDGLVMDG